MMKSTPNFPAASEQVLSTIRMNNMEITDGRSATFNRVLIIGNQGMMGAGLEHLLSNEAALDVFGIEAYPEPLLLEQIRHIQPDTIILVSDSQPTRPGWLFDQLANYGRLRIISVNSQSNIFDVYERQPILAENQRSLIDQIKPESSY